MSTRDELDAMKQEVEKFLKEGLEKHVGEGTVDGERVRAALGDALEKLNTGGDVPEEIKKYNAVATDLLSTLYLGIPQDFNPQPMLRGLPTHFLVLLRESFGHVKGYPLNIIWLEILYREEKLIGDWSFERISSVEAKLNFTLKQKLDYIALDMTINEEKKN